MRIEFKLRIDEYTSDWFKYSVTTDTGNRYTRYYTKSDFSVDEIAREFANTLAREEYGCGFYPQLKSAMVKLIITTRRKLNLDKDF